MMRPQPQRLDPNRFYIARPWVKQEDERLKAAVLRGQPAERIAISLGRTVHAVRGRATKLGITMRKRGWSVAN